MATSAEFFRVSSDVYNAYDISILFTKCCDDIIGFVTELGFKSFDRVVGKDPLVNLLFDFLKSSFAHRFVVVEVKTEFLSFHQ